MNNRKYSNRQERNVGRALGGKRVANSGAAPFVGGDVRTRNFLVECKTTGTPRKSFSVKREWLDKVREEAIGAGKRGWALCFEFENGSNERFYVVSERMLKLLDELLEEE